MMPLKALYNSCSLGPDPLKQDFVMSLDFRASRVLLYHKLQFHFQKVFAFITFKVTVGQDLEQ